MLSPFHAADKRTHHKIMLVACRSAAFVATSF